MGQTIFGESVVALSSGRLPSGVAVVRISGPHSRFALETFVGSVPAQRLACYRKLFNRDGEILDRAVVIFFPGPNSFTGEDIAEFHLHGGTAVVSKVLAELTSLEGVRHAEAGDFTRRAFMNGKIDLVETEALSDLINAETETQRRFALMNADGAQSALYLSWRNRLTHIRAMIEAQIDFADEGDVTAGLSESLVNEIGELSTEIGAHIEGFRAAEIIREGFEIVILGAPNAGKSSLFNALAQRDVAIVNEEAGTTRDLLEVNLDVFGSKIKITDTAGIRDHAGKVEAIGIEKAISKTKDADLVLILNDMIDPSSIDIDWVSAPILTIGTKSDLVASSNNPSGIMQSYDFCVSVKTASGLAELIDELGRRAISSISSEGQILPSRLRHVKLLEASKSHLVRASDLTNNDGMELIAEELRIADDQLGRIIGNVDVEDLLDVIFSEFCIGK